MAPHDLSPRHVFQNAGIQNCKFRSQLDGTTNFRNGMSRWSAQGADGALVSTCQPIESQRKYLRITADRSCLSPHDAHVWHAMAARQGIDHDGVRLPQRVVHKFNSPRCVFLFWNCRRLRSVRVWLYLAGYDPNLGEEECKSVTVARCRCEFCQLWAYRFSFMGLARELGLRIWTIEA